MTQQPATQRIDTEIVKQGMRWHIKRSEIARRPLLGGVVSIGSSHQRRIVEHGAVVAGMPGAISVYGPGHAYDFPANERCLYVPIDVLEWVAVASADAVDAPEIDHAAPRADPIPLPFPEPVPVGLYPNWAEPFLAFPPDVATWASCLDVRATSLSQRIKRLTGVGPKDILTAVRATIAFELAAHYRGHGVDLAADAGYASQAHLSTDMSARFGAPLTELLSDAHRPELDWLRLVRAAVR